MPNAFASQTVAGEGRSNGAVAEVGCGVAGYAKAWLFRELSGETPS
jgi:hypothetical protein